MNESTSKEQILKNIRNALINKEDLAYKTVRTNSDIFKKSDDDIDVQFATEFTKNKAKFLYCENEYELQSTLKQLIDNYQYPNLYCSIDKLKSFLENELKEDVKFAEKAETSIIAITGCEYLIARTGSVMISSKQLKALNGSNFPRIHIVIADSGQLTENLENALEGYKSKYGQNLPSWFSLITGPARTMAFDNTPHIAAKGKNDLYLLFLDNNFK